MIEWIVVLSMCIQAVAAFLALRFFEGLPAKKGWLFISIAVFMMIFRRLFGLLRTTGAVQDFPYETIGLIEETVGFLTSCFLLVGFYYLGSLFRFIQESSERVIAGERKYRSIFHGVSDAIFIIDKDGVIIDCNESAEKLLGFKSNYLVGSHLSLFTYYPDCEALQKSISVNKQDSMEWVLVGSDGRKIETELRTNRLLINGEEGILCIFRDRSEEKRMQRELKESYEYLDVLFDKNPIPIFTLDESGRVVLWNLSCAKLTGIPKEDIIGRKPCFESLYPGRKAPPTLAELLLVFDASSLAKKFERRGVSLYLGMSDAVTCETVFEVYGSKKIVKLIASRLYNRNNEFIGVIQIAQDITLERVLERYASQVQRMESLGRLAGGIAHDFRNILMVIQNSTELLKYRLKDHPEVKHYVREVGVAVEHGVSLCRQFMGFAAEGVDEQKILRALNVNNIIGSLERFIRRVFREDVHIQIELDPNIGKVKAYPGQIDRALLNLFLNAQDAMPHGGTLHVETRDVTVSREEIPPGVEDVKPGRFVRITVKDTGVGMDEKTLGRIFEPFFSGKKEAGHGLGLYVVWREIRSLGGFIQVESAPSFGTAFYCYLPVCEERDEGEEIEDSEEPVGDVSPKRVLVVEDNLALKDIMIETLRSLGHFVEGAGSVREALLVLERRGGLLEVVLCDARLPDGSGYRIIKELQYRFPHVRPVLMTGYTEKDILDECKKDGIPVLIKPFSVARLQEIFAGMEESPVISAKNDKGSAKP